jgi:hypothetical protein
MDRAFWAKLQIMNKNTNTLRGEYMTKAQHDKAALISRYASAIKEADWAATQAHIANQEDGGTCNLDTVLIDFTGWKQTDIDKLVYQSGIRIGNRMSGWHKGSRFVWTSIHGQGNGRSRMVEAAANKLKELDIPASVWYQMD